MIGADVTLSAGFAPGQDLGPDPIVRIGDRVVLGRGSHVVGHRSIEIGDDVYTGPYVYVTDQNHVYADPDVPIGRQWPTEAPVRIGNGSWLGTGVVDPAGLVHRRERGGGRRVGRARHVPRPLRHRGVAGAGGPAPGPPRVAGTRPSPSAHRSTSS